MWHNYSQGLLSMEDCLPGFLITQRLNQVPSSPRPKTPDNQMSRVMLPDALHGGMQGAQGPAAC
jgi:hypothetical protein